MSIELSPDDHLPGPKRLFAPGPKRILTLDGGGVRGIVTIAFLREMEKQLRLATGRKELVLGDVFDLIAGTSVGAMLATMLALGKEAAEVESAFRDLAPKIFSGRETLFGQKRFAATPLVNGVRSILAGVPNPTLGSPSLVTGLGIIAKRVDTDSVWTMTNNPRMPYYEDGADYDGNKNYKLEMLIRASTAAPFLFTPAEIDIHVDRFGKKKTGYFVDGGVTPHNNPALQFLLVATMPAYKLEWRLSPDDLLMISVGTGMHRSPVDRNRKVVTGMLAGTFLGRDRREDIEEAYFAAQTLRSLVGEAGVFALKMMQSLSNPRFSWKINTEVDDLSGELMLAGAARLADHLDSRGLVRFQRYDLPLERGGLVPPQFDVDATMDELRLLHAIDNPVLMDRLNALATDVAQKQVSMKDFEGFI